MTSVLFIIRVIILLLQLLYPLKVRSMLEKGHSFSEEYTTEAHRPRKIHFSHSHSHDVKLELEVDSDSIVKGLENPDKSNWTLQFQAIETVKGSRTIRLGYWVG